MPINRWNYKLALGDVFRAEHLTFEQRRNEIVHRIRTSRFYSAED